MKEYHLSHTTKDDVILYNDSYNAEDNKTQIKKISFNSWTCGDEQHRGITIDLINETCEIKKRFESVPHVYKGLSINREAIVEEAIMDYLNEVLKIIQETDPIPVSAL